MSTHCPHCTGEIGYSPQLENRQVGCPHCGKAFAMHIDQPPPRQPTERELLDLLLQSQSATNKLLATIAQHTDVIRWCAFQLFVLVLILLGLLIVRFIIL